MTAPDPDPQDVLAHWLALHPWVWRKAILPTQLTPGAKVIGFAIVDFFIGRENGMAWPAYVTIAAKCNMTERGVRGGVAAMIAAGFLTAQKMRFSGTNEIRLSLPAAALLSVTTLPDWLSGMTVTESNPSPSSRSNRHNGDAQSVTVMPPNLSTEPSLEPKPDSSLGADEGNADHLPGINYDDVPADVLLPDGLLGKIRDADRAKWRILREAYRYLGYRLDLKKPAPRIDGTYVDQYIELKFPPAALAEALKRCAAGTLNERVIAKAVVALGIPRFESEAAR